MPSLNKRSNVTVSRVADEPELTAGVMLAPCMTCSSCQKRTRKVAQKVASTLRYLAPHPVAMTMERGEKSLQLSTKDAANEMAHLTAEPDPAWLEWTVALLTEE
jgi:hypothetical protein